MPKLPKPPLPPVPGRPAQAPRPGEDAKRGPVDQAKEAGISAVDWVDERTSLSGGLRWMLFRKVPKGTNWFYTLGSATMFAFLSQAMTGVFLAMYYRPDATGGAYESVRYLTNEVFLGEFVRGMHRWGSTVMVILIFLHMARTFFFGAYKYPRELNWVIGVVLLILTMTMSLHGLPAAVRPAVVLGDGRGPNITAPARWWAVPGDFLRGGAEFGATTLPRFYAIHMMVRARAHRRDDGGHLYLVAKLGATAPPWLKADLPDDLKKEQV